MVTSVPSGVVAGRGVEQLGHRRAGHAGVQVGRVVPDDQQHAAIADRGGQRREQGVAQVRRQLDELRRDQVEGIPARAAGRAGPPGATRCARRRPGRCRPRAGRPAPARRRRCRSRPPASRPGRARWRRRPRRSRRPAPGPVAGRSPRRPVAGSGCRSRPAPTTGTARPRSPRRTSDRHRGRAHPSAQYHRCRRPQAAPMPVSAEHPVNPDLDLLGLAVRQPAQRRCPGEAGGGNHTDVLGAGPARPAQARLR